MKKIMLSVLALGILATSPASAQEFRLRAGPDGVTIRNDDDRGRRDGRRDDRRFEERRFEDRRGERRVYRREPDCRMVTTRRERPNGTIVVRRERVCR